MRTAPGSSWVLEKVDFTGKTRTAAETIRCWRRLNEDFAFQLIEQHGKETSRYRASSSESFAGVLINTKTHGEINIEDVVARRSNDWMQFASFLFSGSMSETWGTVPSTEASPQPQQNAPATEVNSSADQFYRPNNSTDVDEQSLKPSRKEDNEVSSKQFRTLKNAILTEIGPALAVASSNGMFGLCNAACLDNRDPLYSCRR